MVNVFLFVSKLTKRKTKINIGPVLTGVNSWHRAPVSKATELGV